MKIPIMSVVRLPSIKPRAELFPHRADVDVRGIGPTRASAFEQAALALTLAVTDPADVASQHEVGVTCEAPNDAFSAARLA